MTDPDSFISGVYVLVDGEYRFKEIVEFVKIEDEKLPPEKIHKSAL